MQHTYTVYSGIYKYEVNSNVVPTRKIIFSISKSLNFVNFITQIKYYRFKNIQIITSFKIWNDIAVCILLDTEDKFWSWNKKLRDFEMEKISFLMSRYMHFG